MTMQGCVVAVLCAAYLVISFGEVQKQEESEDYDYDYAYLPKNCSVSESIAGGWVSYSEGGAAGSTLTYHCEEGHYPFPVSQRVCSTEGEWSTMRLANGRTVAQATCKEVLCPAQLQLDNGEFWPREQWFRSGETQEFSCQDGFTLYGSAVRNCTPWGEWTGTTPVCDDQVDDCMNPGTPPGALRSGDHFRVGEKVQYRCHMGLDLLGSSERVCLESREWSGSDARCLAQFAFDSPNMVAQAMAGSLAGVMDVTSPEFKKKVSFGRSIRPGEGRLNVFILLDNSGSISEKHFLEARKAIEGLIRKLDSYEVNLKYEIISYASQARNIVSIVDPESHNADYVLHELREFKRTDHGTKRGTNLYAALHMVYASMAFLKESKESKFNETQNVILIVTDGQSNTGKSPKNALMRIRALLDLKDSLDHTHENLLDVYVFGVGSEVRKKELNEIASKKQKEKHIFILEKFKDLGEVFDEMISDSAVTMCGIAQESVKKSKENTRPWNVEITTMIMGKMENCKGSIVTQNWIMTAAHCFNETAVTHPKTVTVKHGKHEVKTAVSVILHPQYNVRGLRHKNVKEFYDYDIALIKLNQSIQVSGASRPICLPCTKPASSALKMGPESTCEQHKKALFHLEETQAHFLTKNYERKQTHIQTGAKRLECIKHAAVTFSPETTVSLTEVVTDRFLCTGGSQSYKDAVTCKGDSGGSLFLRKRQRYLQGGCSKLGQQGCVLQTIKDT
ncbi:hypothetical protein MATL_G00117700 [Megalops atlanticus]|uniref:C3/C5 convertase n=1 Tax=Megalops atlanticus TaxID=7932 RepID=A0A9D3TB90_MEGAT|nr:hypothetical protein MATL_G00117700 [Megalops atlanticus]